MSQNKCSIKIQCSICLDMIIEPVTLLCGHNFCRICEATISKSEEGIKSCPLCRYNYVDEPRVNIVLHNILEEIIGNEYKEECIRRNFLSKSRIKRARFFPSAPFNVQVESIINQHCLTIHQHQLDHITSTSSSRTHEL